MKNIKLLNPKEIRALIRREKWGKPTAGLAMGYARPIWSSFPKNMPLTFFSFASEIQNLVPS